MSMPEHHDIDFIFRQWPYQPGVIAGRLIQAHDGREVLQMRIEMGLLQMEAAGRPDGETPQGKATYLDWIHPPGGRARPNRWCCPRSSDSRSTASFSEFYHRRICCLALR